MLGRLPWFAFERRRRALRFLVFFDIGATRYGETGAIPLGDASGVLGQTAAESTSTTASHIASMARVASANSRFGAPVGSATSGTSIDR